MDMSSCFLFDEEYSTLNLSAIMEDSIDEYLVDPTLSVYDMIEKYEVPTINDMEKKNLRCVVCSARAFGYNFDQISCESCKAFFRRNALKDMTDLHCRFSGHCNITFENRRHCSYCRIQKCFSVGMRKEWIRTEAEKTMKRAQSEKNRRRKRILQTIQTIEIPSLMLPGRLNHLMILSPTDRTRLNNITHCYEQFTVEPSMSKQTRSSEHLVLRLDEFLNRKKTVVINFISYFKHLPELQALNIDDQVSLIKQNIRLLLPINYALLKTPPNSKFGTRRIETIGCRDNINLHQMFQSLSNIFVQFVSHDPMLIKLLIIVIFFTTNSFTTIFDSVQYKELNQIKQIQTSYIELLWLYITEKWGEKHAIDLFMKLIAKYLYIQVVFDQIDTIIRMNSDAQYVDSLMKTVLQLT